MPPAHPKGEDRHFLYAFEENCRNNTTQPLSHDACKRIPLWILLLTLYSNRILHPTIKKKLFNSWWKLAYLPAHFNPPQPSLLLMGSPPFGIPLLELSIISHWVTWPCGFRGCLGANPRASELFMIRSLFTVLTNMSQGTSPTSIRSPSLSS